MVYCVNIAITIQNSFFSFCFSWKNNRSVTSKSTSSNTWRMAWEVEQKEKEGWIWRHIREITDNLHSSTWSSFSTGTAPLIVTTTTWWIPWTAWSTMGLMDGEVEVKLRLVMLWHLKYSILLELCFAYHLIIQEVMPRGQESINHHTCHYSQLSLSLSCKFFNCTCRRLVFVFSDQLSSDSGRVHIIHTCTSHREKRRKGAGRKRENPLNIDIMKIGSDSKYTAKKLDWPSEHTKCKKKTKNKKTKTKKKK